MPVKSMWKWAVRTLPIVFVFVNASFVHGDITGVAFHDIDIDGINDSSDLAVAGIRVDAYNSTNTVVSSSITSATGAYTLSGNTTPVRLEFTIPASLPGLESTSTGSNHGTSVVFAIDGDAVDAGFAYSAEYCQNNPEAATNCYVEGDQALVPAPADKVIVSVSYDTLDVGNTPAVRDRSDNTYLATAAQIGTTWGLAWQRETRRLYAGAFMKRFAGYGPGDGSVGADPVATIYQLNEAGSVTGHIDLSVLLSTANVAGTDPHEFITGRDSASYAVVGRAGFGDIDLDDTGDTLYVVNLANDTLYALDVSSGTAASTTLVNSWSLPDTGLATTAGTCLAANVRPFALKVWRNTVYAGSVCEGPATNDLHAYVHALDTTSGLFTLQLDFPLNYDRDPVGPGDLLGPGRALPANWQPWNDSFVATPTGWGFSEYANPQAWLTDIEFTPSGDMILGIRDRYGDQAGDLRLQPNAPDATLYRTDSAGDTLHACFEGGSWVIENDSITCAGNGAANSGPGGSEFYAADSYNFTAGGFVDEVGHYEIAMGGLAQLALEQEVMVSGYDTLNDDETTTNDGSFSGGLFRMSTVDGSRTGGYRIFDSAATGTFGKAAGVGDLELLCDAAPIQIGNYIWFDLDNNGIQDPDEAPVVSVAVELWADTTGNGNADTLVGTTTTDGSGNYIFGGPTDTNMNQAVSGFASIPPQTAFEVRVPLTHAAIANTSVSPAGGSLTSSALNDAHDADGDNGVLHANYSTIQVTTGRAGQNDHSLDFGFVPLVSIGSTVFYDNDNNGIQDATVDPGISGVTVQLYSAGSTAGVDAPVASLTTGVNGDYHFENLLPGDYFVHVPVPPADAPLSSTDIASSGADNQIDSDDNGAQTSRGDPVSSPTITLLSGLEPVNESGNAGTQDSSADSSGDMTVDFGFVPSVAIGSTVFLDLNNDGLQAGVGETGIAGVGIELYAAGSNPLTDTAIASTTTSGSGDYLFDDLAPGNYVVYIPTPPAIAPLSSTDIITTPGDNQTDGDDNGAQSAPGGAVISPTITLSNNGEPAGETSQGGGQDAADDNNGDMTVDFGFVPSVSIGSTVFYDNNNDAQQGAGEVGIAAVGVELYLSSQTPLVDTPIATTSTNSSGDYLFAGLHPGDYVVVVPTPPSDAPTSSTDTVNTVSDNQIDSDDNGLQVASGSAAISPTISLAIDGETTSESGQGGSQDNADDNNGDMTVDFGFVPFVSIGSTVFYDDNNNGVQDGTEAGISGVTVELYADGDTPGTSSPVTSTATNGSGDYLFSSLLPGNYIVYVPTPPADAPTSSTDIVSSSSDNQIDADDNGAQSVVGGSATSPVINLVANAEPTSETGQGGNQDSVDDNNGDMTVDFGFVPYVSIGSTVFIDNNNDALQGAGEAGISTITVELYASTQTPGVDAPLATDTTDTNGDYYFGDLLPGDYIVYIPVPPAGAPHSSTDIASTPVDNQTDSDDNGAQASPNGPVTSPVISLTPNAEPSSESGQGASQDSADDNNGDMTVDFGFVPSVSIGSTVFYDDNNDGLQGAGETGIGNVDVELYLATQTPGSDTPVASATTDGSGDYFFAGLLPQDYVVYLPTPPVDAPVSSTDIASSTADNQTDSDDNGQQANSGDPVVSPTITLTVDGEPSSETGQAGTQDSADDDNGDMTIDFGFVKPVSIGSTVFYDNNNDALQGAGETGISGVAVELYRSSQTPGTDTPVATTSTNSSGDYLFSGLLPGDYVVYIPTAPADAPASSTDIASSAADNQTDSDDNGQQASFAGPVTSPAITLLTDTEPVSESGQGGAQDASADNDGDMTIDFGFVPPLLIGSTVFYDDNNNSVQDGIETGIANVDVELYLATQTPGVVTPVLTTTTDGSGDYLFDSLLPGDYVVYVPTPPSDAPTSSADISTSTGDNQTDSDDNGQQLNSGDPVVSPTITLTVDGEPTSEGGQGGVQDAADDNNGDMTVDFGFIPYVSIGSTVFYDNDNSGTQDAGELGIGSITVELYADGDTPGSDTPVDTVATSANGDYYFDDLLPGNYLVHIPTPPAGAPTSSTDIATSTADNQTDSDDNGLQALSGGSATSPVIALQGHAEPVTETGQGGSQDNAQDTSGDMTVDFGFVPSVSLGSTVFTDDNGNSVQDGSETGIAGVAVELYLATQTPGSDTPIATIITDTNGDYLFDDQLPGDYVVYIPSPPVSALLSSPDISTTNGDNQTDSDDNGLQATSGDPVSSPVITLTAFGEPAAEAGQGGSQDNAADTSGDMTVDFGFVPPVSLGSTVFYDDNNNALQDSGELGIAGVAIELYAAGDTPGIDSPTATTTTNVDGDYLFDGLVPGDYFVVIPTPPANAPNSSADVASSSADNQIDSDDNGQQATTGGPVTSPIITLAGDSEPTAESGQGGSQDDGGDSNGDMTVDFGFVPGVSIGSTVFYDNNNNGMQDAGEPGVRLLTVELYADGDTPGTSTPVATTTTDTNGDYLFQGLLPDDYLVYLPTPPVDAPLSSTDLSTSNGDNQTDSDDNGLQSNAGDPVTSPVINLTVGIEPTDETGQGGAQDSANDSNGDMTVDFGFAPYVSIGSTVFYDNNDNALQDGIDAGIPGVRVELYAATATPGVDTAVASVLTDSQGDYLFTDLLPGDYVVYLPNPPIDAPLSSTDITTTTVDNQIDSDDNGVQSTLGAPVTSPVINLIADSEPTVEMGQGGSQDSSDDDNGDMTVDFGFSVPVYDLALIKEISDISRTPVVNSTQVTYTITVMNQGNYPSGAFSVEDTLPAGLRFVSATPTANAVSGQVITFAVPLANELAAGVTTTFTVIAEVDDVSQAPFRNEAQIVSDSGAPYGGDDDSSPDDGSGSSDTYDDTDVSNDSDPGDEDDSDFSLLPVTDAYDLALIKETVSVSPLPATLNSDVTYRITVMNQGGVNSGSYSVADTLPAGMTFISATPATSSDPGVGSTGVVEWQIAASDELLPGQSASFVLVARIADDSLSSYRNEAEISVDSGDPHGGDDDSTPGDGSASTDTFDDPDVTNDSDPGDQDDSDFEVLSLTPEYDLALIKRTVAVSASPATVGTEVTYAITVMNQGNVASGSFEVTDVLPAGMSFVSANPAASSDPGAGNGGTVQWAVAATDELLPGADQVFELVARIDDASQSPFKNVADITIDSGTPYGGDDDSTPGDGSGALDTFNDDDVRNDQDPGDQDDSDFETLSTDSYDLALIKTLVIAQPTPITLGSQLTFTITVMNQSGEVSGAFSVLDTMPAQLGFVSALPAPVSHPGVGNTGTVQWDIPASNELQPGTLRTITLVTQVIADEGGDWRNSAEIIADSGDDDDSDPEDGSGTLDTIDDLDVTNDNDPGDQDDSDFADFTIPVRYDLSLVKRLDANQSAWIVQSQTVNFDISVLNQGNVPSGDFSVVDTLPAGMSFISAGGTNVSCVNDTPIVGQVQCDYTAPDGAALAPDTEVVIDVALSADDLSQAPFKNWAEIFTDSAQSLYGVDDDDSVTDSNIGAGDPGAGEGSEGADATVDENDHNDITDNSTDQDDSDPALVRAASSTPISLVRFSSERQSDNSVQVSWTTSLEDANRGFHLYGRNQQGQWQRLNESIVPSQALDDDGETYSLTVSLESGTDLVLTDVDLFGAQVIHGPYVVGRVYGDVGGLSINDTVRLDDGVDPPLVSTSKEALYLKTDQSGIYRVTYEAILDKGYDWSGVPVTDLALSSKGEAYPLRVVGARDKDNPLSSQTFGAGGFVEFIADEIDSLYTKRNVYRLAIDAENAVAIGQDSQTTDFDVTSSASHYTHTQRWEIDRYYSRVAPTADPWYAFKMTALRKPASRRVIMTLSGVDAGQAAQLRVYTWAAGDTPQVDGDHHLVVSVNGLEVGDVIFDGVSAGTVIATIPAGVLINGENTITLTLPVDRGVDSDSVSVDRIELDYARRFRAVDGQLHFADTGDNAFNIRRLNSRAVSVYRRDNTGVVRLNPVIQAFDNGYFGASFAGSDSTEGEYYVADTRSLLTPSFGVIADTSAITQPPAQAHYLVIAHRRFINADLDRLIQARQADGLSTHIVDVSALYAHYTHGVKDPEAIRSYIKEAVNQLGTRYVLLVGGDTYDYKGHLKSRKKFENITLARSLIPTLYGQTGQAVRHAPVDPLLADINGDGIPDVPLGRAPVQTREHWRVFVDKTLQYARSDHGQRAVIISDGADDSTRRSFAASAASAARELKDWQVQQLPVDHFGQSETTRRFKKSLERGRSLSVYFGHSDKNLWSFDRLLSRTDIGELVNMDNPTAVLQLGCWNTYYVEPRANTLSNFWLTDSDAGAALVMGASTLAEAGTEEDFGRAILAALAEGQTYGEAVQSARGALVSTYGIESVRDLMGGFVILGDPALLVPQGQQSQAAN